jgi:hypothetical protein
MKIIKGWVSSSAFTDPSNKGTPFALEYRKILSDQPATLIIGDTPAPSDELEALRARVAELEAEVKRVALYEDELKRRARLAWEAGVGKRPDSLERTFLSEVEKLIDFCMKRERHNAKPYETALGRQARNAEIYLNAIHEDHQGVFLNKTNPTKP